MWSRLAARSFLTMTLAAGAGCTPLSPWPLDAGAELQAACEGACGALARPGCEETGSTGSCDGQCTALVNELDGFCVEEHVALYECLGETEYTCVDGAAQPVEGPVPCYPQTLTTYGCVLGLACKKYCRAAEDVGCGGATCLDECEAGRPANPSCDVEYGALRACQIEGMACSSGEPAPAGCGEEEAALAACDGP